MSNVILPLRDDQPLYAGLANLKLAVDPFELGDGVVLSGTYANLMSTLLIACTPPTPQKPYGEPWAAVSGGYSFGIGVQLHVPTDFQRSNWFDRLNTIWWIAALIRLRTSPAVVVPVISDRPFAEVPEQWRNANLHAVEVAPRRILPHESAESITVISEDDLNWIRTHWLSGGAMMRKHRELNTSFQAFDYSASSGSIALALISLWGALEELFSPAKQELRFRVSSSIAAFLEPSGEDRWQLHKRILKLYDARSKVAHGTGGKEWEPFRDTYLLMQRVLIIIIEEDRLWSRDEIERRLFGCDDRPRDATS